VQLLQQWCNVVVSTDAVDQSQIVSLNVVPWQLVGHSVEPIKVK